ncbi:MAG: NUDIX domain-containing protein [Bacteroidetes bacterium]|nr:NUDIX domain-containing protein [Bacteroidota bacterium]
MYKVFINNRPLILAQAPFVGSYKQGMLYIRYDAPALLREIILQAHASGENFPEVLLVHGNVNTLLADFENSCTVIEAAGGRVLNKKGHTLMIFRSGRWDLPKGKIDPGETPEQAALREVEEECGISGLQIEKQLQTTWHTYMHGNEPIIKKTYWYLMHCTDTRKLVPQLEEGITQAEWLDDVGLYQAMKNTYRSVTEIIGQP